SCGGSGIIDNCGVCNGDGTSCECPGYPESACDCNGNVYDCNQVCGGSAVVDACGICAGDGSTCLSLEDHATPGEFILHQNFPNPFNPVTHIRYSVGEYSQVELRVLDLQGRKLETLQSHYHAPGRYTLTWNAIGLASGVYLVEMVYYNSDKISERLMMKMVVVR
ncbi:MAG: T9SS type A sorting domain-containing protein, partial [Candidatus Marinimicrobia bacterium]|nr:T9SS type A sorting domain-containing protein [Candidatus Neomarinimicrobiota bacterium]